jgi:OFA family oxalate/formate antiporter-like MFS transporter
MHSPNWPAEDHPRFATRVLAGAALGILFGSGPLLFHSGGVFVIPIATDTGWSRGAIASAIGSTSLILGLMSPVTGILVDRLKPRRFAMLSMLSIGLGLILLGLVPQSAETFILMMGVAAILASGQMPHAYTLSVASWFERRRGLALGTILSFTGVGLALFAPLAAALIGELGWRMTYVTMGATVGILGFIAAATLVRDPPGPKSTGEPEEGLTWREAVATRRFWLMLGAFFLIAAAIGAGTVHLPVIIANRGIDSALAAAALSVVGLTTVASRFLFGFLLDRFYAPTLAAIVFLAPALGHLLLAIDGSGMFVVAGAILLGVGLGAEVDALAYIAARAFGFRNFGKIFGLFFLGIGVGGGLAPVAIASLTEFLGGYGPALIMASAVATLSALLIFLVGREPLPYTVRDR